jgi:hypothetical protein
MFLRNVHLTFSGIFYAVCQKIELFNYFGFCPTLKKEATYSSERKFNVMHGPISQNAEFFT